MVSGYLSCFNKKFHEVLKPFLVVILAIILDRITQKIDYSFSIYRKQTTINKDEMQYLQLLNSIYNHGSKRKTRNAEVISSFSEKMTFDLRNGFPLLTSKKIG